jgi:hypothetical protein
MFRTGPRETSDDVHRQSSDLLDSSGMLAVPAGVAHVAAALPPAME